MREEQSRKEQLLIAQANIREAGATLPDGKSSGHDKCTALLLHRGTLAEVMERLGSFQFPSLPQTCHPSDANLMKYFQHAFCLMCCRLNPILDGRLVAL